MDELNIELTCTNSPQAKGRVGRANRTLQDRLVKELRFANISTIADANRYLPKYIEKHNQRFAIVPRDETDAHRLIDRDLQLGTILASRYQRKLTKDMLFHHEDRVYQITTASRRLAFPFARIDVNETPDGSLLVQREGQVFEFVFIRDRRPAWIVSAKDLNGHLDKPRRQLKSDQKKAHWPARNHPWQLHKVAAAASPNSAPKWTFLHCGMGTRPDCAYITRNNSCARSVRRTWHDEKMLS